MTLGNVVWNFGLACGLLLAPLTVGCLGTPTPLVPTLEGSVGYPYFGVQTDAQQLPSTGPGYVRFRPDTDISWGRPRLIAAIADAAQHVSGQLPGGKPLLVGDLSAQFGGEIPRHRSHRSGRDVDLLWYVTTPSGVPTYNPGFVHVGPDLLAHTDDGYVRLDVPRQWALIRRLLTSPEMEVQWIFCSRPVEAILIDYARAREEDYELLWRAETVLLQPGDSLAHDDHIHVRIACTPEESIQGCHGGGPHWNWLSELPTLEGPINRVLEEVAVEDPLTAKKPDDHEQAAGPTKPDSNG